MKIECQIFFKPRGRKSKKMDWLLKVAGEIWCGGVIPRDRIPDLLTRLQHELSVAFSKEFGEPVSLDLGECIEFGQEHVEPLLT